MSKTAILPVIGSFLVAFLSGTIQVWAVAICSVLAHAAFSILIMVGIWILALAVSRLNPVNDVEMTLWTPLGMILGSLIGFCLSPIISPHLILVAR